MEFDYQRQVGGFVLGASYGTHTVNIPYERNIDQPVASTTPFSISALPYPNYASVDWADNGATERYNALQLYVRRTSERICFSNAGLTWAKDLTDAQDQSSFSGLENSMRTTAPPTTDPTHLWYRHDSSPMWFTRFHWVKDSVS